MDTDTSISQCCTTMVTYMKNSETIKSSLFNFKTDIIWYVVLQVALLHIIGIYGICTFNYLKNPMTTLWIIGMYIISNFGASAGAHRFWSHKSFKAKLPLKILLLLCYSSSVQNRLGLWVRNHRMHHKYCDTDADPHNTQRGFFFTHIGWIMMKEHPKFIEKSKQINMSDFLSDPVVVFGEKYYLSLQLFFGFILPTIIPVYLWNETWARAIISQIFIRYIITLHTVWTINSIAHAWGTRPYDKNIKPTDNIIINYLTLGEVYHNYHHVFPWDYRAAEIGNNRMNYTTLFIDMFAKLGLAYDLKYPSMDLIKKTVLKRGGRTHLILSEVLGPKSD